MTQLPYNLQVDPEGLARVRIESPAGRPIVDLLLLSGIHTDSDRFDAGRDELLEVEPVQVEAISSGLVEISQSARSTRWDRKRAVLRSYPDRLEYWCEIEGRGAIHEVQLFEAGQPDPRYRERQAFGSGPMRPARQRGGWEASRPYFSTVFNPVPNALFQQYGWWGEARQTIGAGSNAGSGGARVFSPAPFAFAVGEPGRWLTLGLGVKAEDAGFLDFQYRGGPAWGLSLDYGGQTEVRGRWSTPRVLLKPVTDEYAGLVAYRDWLIANEYSAAAADPAAEWWGEPIWTPAGERSQAAASRSLADYQGWLGSLEGHGVHPGTIIIGPEWMARPGWPEPDESRWSGLQDFIAKCHRAGQRVILTHRFWLLAPESVDGRTLASGAALMLASGSALTVLEDLLAPDPTSLAYQRHLRELLIGVLGPPPHGLGADGLKLVEAHWMPAEFGMVLPDGLWGTALAHSLMALVYRLAKEIRPDALIEHHAANPLFRDTGDVLGLNQMETDLRSVADMMRHRALVAKAAGFDLIDTDGSPLPSRETLREYLQVQPDLGIPALHYATRVGDSGEELDASDYELIIETWQRYRRRRSS